MNEELNKVLIDAIQKTQSGIGEAVDFAVAQAPEVIQQLLMWKFTESLITFLFGLTILASISIWLYFKVWKVWETKWCYTEETKYSYHESGEIKDSALFLIFLSIPYGLSFLIVACNLDWLKIWIAPKLYLIEYAASLVK